MYLHVGNNKNIKKSAILAIIDFDNATISEVTRKYLVKNQKEMLIETANDEIPKSFVIYFSEKDGFYKICFSQISAGVLRERMDRTDYTM